MSATTIQIDDYAMTEEANQLKLVLYFSGWHSTKVT